MSFILHVYIIYMTCVHVYHIQYMAYYILDTGTCILHMYIHVMQLYTHVPNMYHMYVCVICILNVYMYTYIHVRYSVLYVQVNKFVCMYGMYVAYICVHVVCINILEGT